MPTCRHVPGCRQAAQALRGGGEVRHRFVPSLERAGEHAESARDRALTEGDEGGSCDNCKARPRAGIDLISGREPVTTHWDVCIETYRAAVIAGRGTPSTP
jgi:hypothetical protein